MSLGYHTYGVDWEPDYITYYFDGQQVFKAPTPADMNEPMYMIANLAVGGYWPGNANSTTPFPAQMKIDYIRAYSNTPPTTPPPTDPPPTDPPPTDPPPTDPPPTDPPPTDPPPTVAAMAGYWKGTATNEDRNRTYDAVALIDAEGNAQWLLTRQGILDEDGFVVFANVC